EFRRVLFRSRMVERRGLTPPDGPVSVSQAHEEDVAGRRRPEAGHERLDQRHLDLDDLGALDPGVDLRLRGPGARHEPDGRSCSTSSNGWILAAAARMASTKPSARARVSLNAGPASETAWATPDAPCSTGTATQRTPSMNSSSSTANPRLRTTAS